MQAWKPIAVVSALVPLAFLETDELSERCTRLEEELPKLLELSAVPGISMAVADREGVRWSAAFGTRDAATGAAVDTDTIFEAASLSKPVFAYAVLQLVGQEVLELDAPLVEYAPLADLEHDPRREALTARMVLSHSTGLPNWRRNGARLEFVNEPALEWRYSGEGFVLLQEAVETLVGDDLQGLAESLVFEPLGMQHSSFVWREEFGENVAFPHDPEGKSQPNRHNEEPNAAWSLLTTASDYALFLAALMRGEELEPDLHEELLLPQIDVSPGVAWGLGVGLEENADGHSFWHWGHNSGYRAYCVAYPARDLALVYFTNSDNGMRLLRDTVRMATAEEDHPAIRHLDYSSYDDLPEKTE